MVYLITYDLCKEGQDYEALEEAIKSNCSEYFRIMQSTILVKSIREEKQVRDSLLQVMDDNDKLFIVPVTRPYDGWLTDNVWKWLSENVS